LTSSGRSLDGFGLFLISLLTERPSVTSPLSLLFPLSRPAIARCLCSARVGRRVSPSDRLRPSSCSLRAPLFSNLAPQVLKTRTIICCEPLECLANRRFGGFFMTSDPVHSSLPVQSDRSGLPCKFSPSLARFPLSTAVVANLLCTSRCPFLCRSVPRTFLGRTG